MLIHLDDPDPGFQHTVLGMERLRNISMMVWMFWSHTVFLDVILYNLFFFYWLNNPGWVLVCSTILLHSCLSSAFTL
jgi:hypothetical protein